MVSSIDRAMLAIIPLLGRSLNPQEVAQAIADAAAQLPTADGAAVLRLDRSCDELYVEAGQGLDEGHGRRLPFRRSLAGRAIEEGRLVAAKDLEQNGELLTPAPAGGGHFASAIAVSLPSDEQISRAISIYRRAGGAFPEGTEEYMSMLAGAASGALSNAQEFQREARAHREQQAINAAALAMSSELSLDRLLELITNLARELVGSRYAALGVPGPTGNLEQFITAGISAEQRARIGSLPEGHGLLGTLLKESKTVRVRRLQDDSRSSGFPPHHPPMASFLGVPIMFRGRNVGDLYLTDKIDEPEFTEDDERIVQMLAAHAAIAIVNATSYGETNQELRQRLAELADKNRELQRLSNGILAAQEDERRRIARELHDDTMQALAALTVRARLLERKQDAGTLRAGIGELREGIGETLRELRRLTYDLRPTALDDLGLTAALSGLAHDFADRAGVAIQTALDPTPERLNAAVEVVLYRIAQEALANVAKHAHATHATIELAIDDESVRLSVRDDGSGFNPAERRSSRESGLGLLGMEERVQALHGRLTIDSRAGDGSVVRVELPRHTAV